MAAKARWCSCLVSLCLPIPRSFANSKLLRFVILFMVVICSSTGDKPFFTMNIFTTVHSMIGSSVDWYADVMPPILN